MKTILILLLFGISLYSQAPKTLNYQGYLTDAGGSAVNDGNQNITFRIYNVSTGGAALWTEARTVTTTDGVFSVVLGENTPINLAFDTQYYLGITVGATELSPRTKLASSAYASNLPKVCFIKDVKAPATTAGTFNSGSWQTRDLNTLQGNTDFVSLNANQFTLDAGKYIIHATVPASHVNNHQARLRNITDGITTLLGTSTYAHQANLGSSRSEIIGEFNLVTQKIFEIQHRCQTTYATHGFGSMGLSGENEVYTVLKITKIAN